MSAAPGRLAGSAAPGAAAMAIGGTRRDRGRYLAGTFAWLPACACRPGYRKIAGPRTSQKKRHCGLGH
jgi:hypothetical protein